jgi:RND family efflux transporter MFP subunit
MNPTNWFTQRKALPLVLIACILLAVIIVKTRPSMQHEPREDFISSVKVIDVNQYSVRPAIKGFGIVKPDILFEAKSEVSGKIIFLHPQLKDGAVFPKDTVVIRIEEDDFQSSLRQAQANSAYNLAKLKEIKVSIQNTHAELKLVKAKLKLAKKEYSRLEELLKKHLVSQSNADAKQADVLKLQQEVQTLNSRLKTLPQQQRSLEANLSSTKAAASSQQRNLERTTITLPFNARISKLNVENNQYITQGSLLFSAQTTDKVLINAQFPLLQFRTLAKDFQVEQDLIRQAFQSGFSSELFTNLGLSAKVRLSENLNASWQAKVERISSSIDPKTRTLGLFVSVDKPNAQIIPGSKPPLLEGMYTEVTIKGNAKKFFVIPRDAIHEGELFIVNKENKLERRALKPSLLQGKMALFEEGLSVGEKIVVSDLFPAIPGMSLNLTKDKRIEQSISDWLKQQAKP